MVLDNTIDPVAGLLWRVRGIDSRWYALFLDEHATQGWVLDLYRDNVRVSRSLHTNQAAATRRARRVFLECQLPTNPTRLWRRAARDGCIYAVYISETDGEQWQITAHRDDVLFGTGLYGSETDALTQAWRAYEELPRPPISLSRETT